MNRLHQPLILLVAMIAASVMALCLRPTHKLSEQRLDFSLEKIVPVVFGDWHEEVQSAAQIVDPLQKERIDKLYSQTLSRTYVNAGGYKVMLSIAYGEDQGDARQVHKPEVCYPAQGFSIQHKRADVLLIGNNEVPVTRVLASMAARVEPITYWVTIGKYVVRGGFEKKLAELRYGIHDLVPDGLLFRVSSIDEQVENAYQIQDGFVRQLLDATRPQDRQLLVGAP